MVLKKTQLIHFINVKGSTADFDPSRLCVDVILYYGTSKLVQKQTTAIPLVKDITSSLQDTKKYELTILNDKLVFDVSDFEQDPNRQKEIYAIVYVKYNNVCKLHTHTSHSLFCINFRISLILIKTKPLLNFIWDFANFHFTRRKE